MKEPLKILVVCLSIITLISCNKKEKEITAIAKYIYNNTNTSFQGIEKLDYISLYNGDGTLDKKLDLDFDIYKVKYIHTINSTNKKLNIEEDFIVEKDGYFGKVVFQNEGICYDIYPLISFGGSKKIFSDELEPSSKIITGKDYLSFIERRQINPEKFNSIALKEYDSDYISKSEFDNIFFTNSSCSFMVNNQWKDAASKFALEELNKEGVDITIVDYETSFASATYTFQAKDRDSINYKIYVDFDILSKGKIQTNLYKYIISYKPNYVPKELLGVWGKNIYNPLALELKTNSTIVFLNGREHFIEGTWVESTIEKKWDRYNHKYKTEKIYLYKQKSVSKYNNLFKVQKELFFKIENGQLYFNDSGRGTLDSCTNCWSVVGNKSN